MKEIRGDAKNLRSLLGNAKFAIDYYQREYRWAEKQVTELINDLVGKFLESYDKNHEWTEVEKYGHYFLGSIIISIKQNQEYIIDGQQRLTTITLLLIHIYQLLKDDGMKGKIANLIRSTKFGRHSFNINEKERDKCMNALFSGKSFDEEGQSESVINILRRFQELDLAGQFSDESDDQVLLYFSDWLIEKVHIVQITAYSDADAYTIFETMNDRGLSLKPAEMLKGYILSEIKDPLRREQANQCWRKLVSELKEIGNDEDSDAIKAWLRSQYARNIRERRRGAKPRDFDLIGTEFHRWVRNHKDKLGLSSSNCFSRFIEDDFDFYAKWYSRLRKASKEIKPGLQDIYYCAQNNFTLQYPVLLAPLQCTDQESEILRKLRIVSIYIDILINRRIWNWRSVSYSAMQYAMFIIMRDIRGKDSQVLAHMLIKHLTEDQETAFSANNRFRLHGNNRPQIHRLLARLTDYVETASGQASRYEEYVRRSGRERYEIEHIWAQNHYDPDSSDFDHPTDFEEYRNRIGGLLLLPKSFNASFGDDSYEKKRRGYLQHNLLAKSLHEDAYERNPGFQQFMRTSGLEFCPHRQFRKDDLDKRQHLYTAIAEQVWNPDRLMHAAES